MAMNATTLGNAIGQTLFNNIPAEVRACMSAAQCAETLAQLQCNWRLIATDIITHITTNAVINTTDTIVIGQAVAPAGSSEPIGYTITPGTGTGVGTIS